MKIKGAGVTLDILLGVTSKARGYDSKKNEVATKLEAILKAKFEQIKKELVVDELKNVEVAIVENVTRDIGRFMDQMTNSFMRIQFSTSNRDTDVYIDSSADGGNSANMGLQSKANSLVITKGRMEQWLDGRGAPMHILWPSLAPSTIKRKIEITHTGKLLRTRRVPVMDGNGVLTSKLVPMYKGGRQVVQARQLDPGSGSYYFRWSGALKSVINAEIQNMLFGDGGMINPQANFVSTNSPGPGQRGDRVGTIKVRLFSRSSFPSGLIGAMNSGDYKEAVNDQSMLNKFLSKKVAEKLGPSRQALVDNKRPWVGPSLAYWVINRFPYIVGKSIDQTIANYKKSKAPKGKVY